MESEKEVRYLVDKQQIKDIIKNTEPYKERMEMLDITCGYDGFDSYKKRGYICRIRQKGDKKTLEVKNYQNQNECLEQAIRLEKAVDGINYLRMIGMEPYLYLKRMREVRKYKNLKIFIDEFDILGDFVEIEYQDSYDSVKEVKEFINLIKIQGNEQDMNGAIVKERLKEDEKFREVFYNELEKILKNY